MNGRKREGTVEIPHGRRILRRRKRLYKTQVEVGGDAGREVGRGHRVAKKARTAKPAGAKGLDSTNSSLNLERMCISSSLVTPESKICQTTFVLIARSLRQAGERRTAQPNSF
jgi:hypothetical protein